MVRWNFDLIWKTIVLLKTLWYYEQNYGTIPRTSIYEGKKHSRFPKTNKLWFIMEKNYGNIQKWLKFLNKWIALEHWYTMEKLFGAMEITIVLWENYGTKVNYSLL